MSITDPISDFLTIIRNGCKARFKYVDIPASKIKQKVAKTLFIQGYIDRFVLIKDRKQGLLRVYLKYDDKGEPVINTIRRISKPGRRKYVDVNNLPRVKNNLGISILTTPKGVMTAIEAKQKNTGGEVLCEVW